MIYHENLPRPAAPCRARRSLQIQKIRYTKYHNHLANAAAWRLEAAARIIRQRAGDGGSPAVGASDQELARQYPRGSRETLRFQTEYRFPWTSPCRRRAVPIPDNSDENQRSAPRKAKFEPEIMRDQNLYPTAGAAFRRICYGFSYESRLKSSQSIAENAVEAFCVSAPPVKF